MRKTLLGGLMAAILSLPAAALAKQNATIGEPRLSPTNVPHPVDSRTSLGGGMQGGNEPGHTTGPGGAQVDTTARGPVNDVDVGRGTNDTPQNRNPPPAR
jgi:hypothetical protein